jgi:hypothetical protein
MLQALGGLCLLVIAGALIFPGEERPAASRSLLGVLATLRPIRDEFPEIADPPPRRVEP